MSEHKCELCGSPVTIGGDDKEGTHYYEPAVSAERLAALEDVVTAARRFVRENNKESASFYWLDEHAKYLAVALDELDKVNL